MKTVYKYELKIQDDQVLKLPKGAEILTVHTQNGNPFIWALVDTDAALENRTLVTFGTGHPVNSANLKYIGTYHMSGGSIVFHLFELNP